MTQLNIKVLLFQNTTPVLHLNWVLIHFHFILTINCYNCSKCYITVALLLKHSFMENYEQHYVSEATEDWVCSGTISFKMPVVGRKKIPKVYIIISICFSYNTVNVFLEGDRAGIWWKPFIFLDEAGFNPAKRWMRGWEPSGWEGPRTMFSVGPDHPPLNVILKGPSSKISAMGPEFLTTALSAIMVSGPSTVYHLVFTPYSPFLTVTRLRSFSPHGGGRFSIGSSQTISLLQAMMMWRRTCG